MSALTVTLIFNPNCQANDSQSVMFFFPSHEVYQFNYSVVSSYTQSRSNRIQLLIFMEYSMRIFPTFYGKENMRVKEFSLQIFF